MNYNEHLNALAAIANKPGASPRTVLIAARHACRLIAGERARLHWALRACQSTAEAASLEQQAMVAEVSLATIGNEIAEDRTGLGRALGFDALCGLLGVSPAHRERARQHGEAIAHIVGSDSENSSTRRGRLWFEQPPLTAALERAVWLVKEDLMTEGQSSTIH